jgi:hypothetical protein
MIITHRKAKYLKPGNIIKVSNKPGRGEFRRVVSKIWDMERLHGKDIERYYIAVRDYGHGLTFEEFSPDDLVKIKVNKLAKDKKNGRRSG